MPEYSDEFFRAYALVSQESSYDFKGTSETIIKREVSVMYDRKESYEESLRKEGESRGIAIGMQQAVPQAVQKLMANANISQQEAKRLLGLVTVESTKDVSSPISSMNVVLP